MAVDSRMTKNDSPLAVDYGAFHDTTIDELKNFIFVKFDATDISNPEISVILKKFDVSGLPAYLIVQGR